LVIGVIAKIAAAINLDDFAISEKAPVVVAKHLRFRPRVRRGRKNFSRQCDAKTDFGERPAPADFIVELRCDFARAAVAGETFDLRTEILLPLREIVRDALRERVGDALVKERLLAFDEELLVAQRAHGQPGEHEARQDDGEHKDECDFFHLCSVRNIQVHAHNQAHFNSAPSNGIEVL
jgi:hypothetical protein